LNTLKNLIFSGKAGGKREWKIGGKVRDKKAKSSNGVEKVGGGVAADGKFSRHFFEKKISAKI
jgi:hypothetical protein